MRSYYIIMTVFVSVPKKYMTDKSSYKLIDVFILHMTVYNGSFFETHVCVRRFMHACIAWV